MKQPPLALSSLIQSHHFRVCFWSLAPYNSRVMDKTCGPSTVSYEKQTKQGALPYTDKCSHFYLRFSSSTCHYLSRHCNYFRPWTQPVHSSVKQAFDNIGISVITHVGFLDPNTTPWFVQLNDW